MEVPKSLVFDLFNKRIYGGTTDVIRVDQQDQSTLYQAFAQVKWRLTSRLTMIPGVHYQYLELNGSKCHRTAIIAELFAE